MDDIKTMQVNVSKMFKKTVDKILKKHSPHRQWTEIDRRYNPGEAFTKGAQSATKINKGDI